MIRSLFRTTIIPALERLFPGKRLTTFLLMLIERRLAKLGPADGLRFLFHLNYLLAPMENDLAVKYDGGIHAKHRLMKYHDFFTDRISESDRVLDVGCGNGAVSHSIATATGASILGMDIDPANIAMARKRHAHPRITFATGDVTTDIPDQKFDIIVLSNVLEHLKDRPAFLSRLMHTTKAGLMLVRVPLFERDWRVSMMKELGEDWRLDPTHETEYTMESFLGELKKAGLRLRYQEVRWGEIWAEVEKD
ncbi:class I SAM-dependent methyltransferase [Pseudodesulfovibrio sp.]|uniref:class I SAM-dependent methyltransferase n=1 Tax=unclassified Pseudodesulfovibrio TaxID=2661612 RepID=UPI003B004559